MNWKIYERACRPHLDSTHTGYTHRRLWAGHKNTKDKYMPSVMNTVNMCQIHQKYRNGGKTLQIVPYSTPRDTNQVSPTI